jgi:Holliday junction resolvase
MSSANKRRGSQWERDIEEHLNVSGLKARRLPRAGSKDIGDCVIEGKAFDIVVEAKNTKTAWASMAQYLREADVEACNYELKYQKPTIGVVATKTRQKGTGEGRIVLTIDQFVSLLRWGGVA